MLRQKGAILVFRMKSDISDSDDPAPTLASSHPSSYPLSHAAAVLSQPTAAAPSGSPFSPVYSQRPQRL